MRLIGLLSFLLLLNVGQAQIKISEKENIPLFHASLGGHLPLNDLAERFGPNASVAGGFLYKTKSNFLFGADFQYLFGNEIYEEGLLDHLQTSAGAYLNMNGEYSDVIMYESGYFAGIRLGYLIPVRKELPNSGIILSVGAGLLEHKIWISSQGNMVPSLVGDYRNGYDRLTNGFAAQGFVGYMHLGKNQFANFFGGIEYTRAWTQNRRSLNYDTRETDTQKRIDSLFGVRIGWMIPIYRGVSSSYYY